MKQLMTLLAVSCISSSFAQDYTSYLTGNTADLDTVGQNGICLMGGASEDDNAMIWFLERANQGDVLVLRASGSDGYNNYMYSSLGVTLNSVETIVFNNANASNDPYVHQAIMDAEAIWFAGGDQWDYVSYWRDTPVDSLINLGVQNKGLVIGGTSAGMAIQGGYYFTAENGTITSNAALNNPFDTDLTVSNDPFIAQNILSNVITDTHYDNPDRKGRHVTFMARQVMNGDMTVKGIACDEYVAVCIDENGIARVFGDYPTYDDNAYFIQLNCDNFDAQAGPEVCSAGTPLTWNLNQYALQVYQIKGDVNANNSFDLNDWYTASGGDWMAWWVDNGVLFETAGASIDCSLDINEFTQDVNVYPNPTSDVIQIDIQGTYSYAISDTKGAVLMTGTNTEQNTIDLTSLSPGVYILQLQFESHLQTVKIQKD